MNSRYTQEVLDGENPLIPFALTYDLHKDLDALGLFEIGVWRGCGYAKIDKDTSFRRYIGCDPLRYRVAHDRCYVTQNTWYNGQYSPHMQDI